MFSTLPRSAPLLCLSLAVVLSVGCSDEPFKRYPVKGKATFADGSKLPGDIKRVIFYGKTNEPRSPSGTIADDGSFTLGSIEEADGAPEGEYTVVVTCQSDADYAKGVVKELANPKYADKKTSPLTVKVPGGVYDFKIEKP